MQQAESDVLAVSDDNEFLTISEVARKLRFSVDTLRRHMVAGKLKDIEWVDFLENGKLRATRESVEDFIQGRRAATKKIYSQTLQKSRG